MSGRQVLNLPDEAYWNAYYQQKRTPFSGALGFGKNTEEKPPMDNPTRAFQGVMKQVFGTSVPPVSGQNPLPDALSDQPGSVTGIDAQSSVQPSIKRLVINTKKQRRGKKQSEDYSSSVNNESKRKKRTKLSEFAAPSVEAISPWLNTQIQK